MRGSQKNKNYKIKWSSDFAYAIGLLTTDGCLSSDGRHFDLTSKDIQLLKTFKKCMDLDIKIGYKSNGRGGKCSRIQFSNTRLYKWLLTIGLKPNKTKTIGVLDIPNKFFFDFLRGHFDGDGCFYSYWDRRWANSFMYYVNFLSASLKHIKWIRESLARLLDIKGALRFERAVWKLEYAKRESLVLLKRMYPSKDVPCLLRKRRKIEKAISLSE